MVSCWWRARPSLFLESSPILSVPLKRNQAMSYEPSLRQKKKWKPPSFSPFRWFLQRTQSLREHDGFLKPGKKPLNHEQLLACSSSPPPSAFRAESMVEAGVARTSHGCGV